MPRNQLTKIDMLAIVLKMKNDLYNGTYGSELLISEKEAVDKALSKVIDAINEYGY